MFLLIDCCCGSTLLIKLQNGAVLPDEGQPVTLAVGGHGTADDTVGFGNVLFQIVHLVGNVRIAVDLLGKGRTLLKLQVLDLVSRNRLHC